MNHLGYVAGARHDENHAVMLDPLKLVEGRALISASSGAGKSWLMRRLLEQTHGQVQQIVLDMEGEFASLRERFDYILAGRDGGDCQAEPRTAKELAHRLLEVQVSAIVDLYELQPRERAEFARTFLAALINSPKALWHPVMLVIDEANVLCPQSGKAESTNAVIDIMARGRKRGIGTILATQRLARLHKDAAAEATNKIIGRCNQDIDRKRAAEELGLTGREDVLSLKRLADGHFHFSGPAFTPTDGLVHVGPCLTSHPKAGQRGKPPAPSSEKVKAALAQLRGLEQKAVEEEREIDRLGRLLKEAEAKLRQAPAPAVDANAVREAVADAEARMNHEYGRLLEALRERVAAIMPKVVRQIQEAVDDLAKAWGNALEEARPGYRPRPSTGAPVPPRDGSGVLAPIYAPSAVAFRNGQRSIKERVGMLTPSTARLLEDGLVGKPARRILGVLVGREPARLTEAQWAALAGMTRHGGAWNKSFGQLRKHGLVERGDDDRYVATPAGRSLCPAAPPPPATTEENIAMWGKALGGTAEKLLRILAARHGHALSKDEIAAAAGMAVTGGGFNGPLNALINHDLVERDGARLKITDAFFVAGGN